jgi:hypothetical protein
MYSFIYIYRIGCYCRAGAMLDFLLFLKANKERFVQIFTFLFINLIGLSCHISFVYIFCILYLYEPRHDKTNKMGLRPAWIQTCLRIRAVWSGSMLFAYQPFYKSSYWKRTAWILEKINVHTVLKYKYPSTFGVLCLHQGCITCIMCTQ